MLQGVLARGTAHAISALSPYVAGKTGTTDGENDAWFIGFTNDVTVAVWVGYDNADGKRRTLGARPDRRQRRDPDLRADHAGGVGAICAQDAAQRPPRPRPSGSWWRARSTSPPASRPRAAPTRKSFVEYFRRDRRGEPYDTQYQLVSRDEAYMARETRDGERHAGIPAAVRRRQPLCAAAGTMAGAAGL